MATIEPAHVLGRDLQIGDTIQVWWHPYRDRIVALEPYRGPLLHLFTEGAAIASFAIGTPMTIDFGNTYKRVA